MGLRIAGELLDRGYAVSVSARSDDELRAAAEQLRREHPGASVRTDVCDVRDREAVRRLVADVEAGLGPIEVGITVAGVIQTGPAAAMTDQHYDDAIATMLSGPVAVGRTLADRMTGRGHGRIGTVTSIGGMVSPPHLLPYATAKFGAVGFSDGLAAALAGTGVTATTVVPGLMRTGGHERASFTGDAPAEYAWFATAASLPLLSVDADRAARRIVSGVLAGAPMVVLTPMAWLAIRVRGLAPGTVTRLMGVANRLLPEAPPRAEESPTVEGREADRRLGSRFVRLLTTLGSRAAARGNER